MKIGFLVNDLHTEFAAYTTTVLALEAHRRKHSVYYLHAEDFSYNAEDELLVHVRSAPVRKKFADPKEFLTTMQGRSDQVKRIAATDLDVIMLRNDPADEPKERGWAETAALIFSKEAARRGVLVLNDPESLSLATNKFYFQLFPEMVRPRTLISRDPAEIKEFVESLSGKAVLKPLQGSGGQSVFLVERDHKKNLNQMIDAIIRDGFLIAQEYLPRASEGDIRLFLVNGRPLEVDGKFAAIRRVSTSGDVRSNMHVGGKAEKVEVDDSILEVAEMVRPKLILDGMFFVGLDIVDTKILEINVFSPGGIHTAGKAHGVNFAAAVIGAIETKLTVRRHSPESFANVRLAMV
ncbi:glutathione synthase [soil metagenome]